MRSILTISCCLVVFWLGAVAGYSEPATTVPTAPSSPPEVSAMTATFSLEQFGAIKTAADLNGTFDKALTAIMAKGGGTLMIPKEVPANWTIPENTKQEAWRRPAAPAPAVGWGYGPSVTIVDCRSGATRVILPPIGGMTFDRTMRLPEGQGMGSWDISPMFRLNNTILRGSTSYRDWLKEDVAVGNDQRFYLRTVRGVFPGAFLNINDDRHLIRIYVKSIGYDKEKQCPYLVADSTVPLKAGALFSNKNHVSLAYMKVNSHTEEQTFDFWIDRYKFSQGDCYLFDARFHYMSDIHSTAGDENGVLYMASPLSETNIFHGTVAAFDAATNALKYGGKDEGGTLGSGRPMINLNPKKWITQGTLIMVRPGSWIDPNDPAAKDPVFEGKTYPTTIEKNVGLRVGGLMRFTKDAPLTKEVVGRYFAIDMPGEYVPAGGEPIRRWYYISGFTLNPDGSKEITVTRHWWGAKNAQSLTLYKEDNYTWDGHIVPLKYIIAPGANLYDVSDGVKSSKRLVKVSPGPDNGTPFDFAPGDPIEQAIGPDPFRPTPFRCWCFESVPGIFPSTIFDIRNDTSEVQRTSVMTILGNSSLDALAKRYDRKTAFQHILLVNNATENVVTFAGDVANAALFFKQPNNRAQPIKWLYADSKKEAALTVSPDDGTLQYTGGALSVPAGVTQVGGLSATNVKAQNLRGLKLPVKAGSKELAVRFPQPETDANYMVVLDLSWLTQHAVPTRTADGFTVQFATPPAQDGVLSWLLVR